MKAATAQIAFRYRAQDSATGVTRTTAKRLADVLGVDETQIIHVDADYPLVYKDTLTNLRAAAAGEKEEWSELYSKFGEIAAKEGFSDIAKAFIEIAKVEKHHMIRFDHYADGIENGTLYKKDVPTTWKCTNCGYIHEGLEAPESCPACAHAQGYFEELPEKY